MKSWLAKTARKLARDVRNPRDAATFFWRAIVPPDPRMREHRARIWGNLPRVALTEIFPGIERENVTILEAFNRNLVSTTDLEELCALAAILQCTGAKNILEIGTYDGSTTVNLAANAPADAIIVTVDLPPQAAKTDTKIAVPKSYRNKTCHVIGEKFAASPHRTKIQQVFGDSAALDWFALRPARNGSGALPFDLIFIDGCHSYDYVLSDTRNALANLRPGGVLLWHDYGQTRDVSKALDHFAAARCGEPAAERPVVIAGTRLAMLRTASAVRGQNGSWELVDKAAIAHA